jgi:hypothetical protein
MKYYSYSSYTHLVVLNKQLIKEYCSGSSCVCCSCDSVGSEYPFSYHTSLYNEELIESFDMVYYNMIGMYDTYTYYFKDLDSMEKFKVIMELS